MTFDWDGWRAGYDEMTYRDHVLLASRFWREYPIQRHFDEVACHFFLEAMKPRRVLEFGGYDGELASLMLAEHPEIEEWTNCELCIEAHEHTVCHDDRYWVQSGYDGDCDALIMSHCAEHMRFKELHGILTAHEPKAVYLAMPLPIDGSAPNWDGYEGTHILELGWESIDQVLTGMGLHSIPPRTEEVRCWSL